MILDVLIWTLYIGVTLWSVSNVILYGSRPTKSLSWLLVIIILPLAGSMLYYLFGVDRRKFKFFRAQQSKLKKDFDEKYNNIRTQKKEFKFDAVKKNRLSQLIKNSTLFEPHNYNKVTTLNDGEKTFESIFEALEKAEKFIHLQYYMFSEGALTERFYKIFKEKISQGVEVRLIYDYVGSFTFRNRMMKRFKDIGVQAYPMLPVRFGNLLYTLNYRNHRKIIVIDGCVGFTGGFNVSDKYIKPISNLGIWKDIHIKIEGPAVHSLHKIFIQDYYFASDKEVLLDKKYIPNIKPKGKHILQIVAAGPDSKQPAIMQQYIGMILFAETSVCIANPYFIPDIAVLEALKIAALSGVTIHILVPESLDSKIAKYSMFSRFEPLLAVGIKIYLRSSFSHSKMILIDGEMASVGSGNFDYRSFEHNFETNALIYDIDIAQQIEKKFKNICNQCVCLEYETFKNRSVWKKFLEGVSTFFSPLL